MKFFIIQISKNVISIKKQCTSEAIAFLFNLNKNIYG